MTLLLASMVAGCDSRAELNHASAQSVSTARADVKRACFKQDETSADDLVEDSAGFTYQGYIVRTHQRLVRIDELNGNPRHVKVNYVTIERRRMLAAKFDADLFSTVGNTSAAGLADLLNNGKKQLIVSQDLPRTGVQWVADLSRGFRIVFNGQKYEVGRERSEMTIADLDGDGVKEIITPITAFYGFEKWRLTVAETPLPSVVFRYDSHRKEYLPANPRFKSCLLADVQTAEQEARASGSLGKLMSVVLDYVLAGEEERAWKLFDEVCDCSDKAQIKADILREIQRHPLYRYFRRN